MPFFWGFVAGVASAGALAGARKIYQAYQCPSHLDVTGPYPYSNHKRRVEYNPADTHAQLKQKLQQAYPDTKCKTVQYYEVSNWDFKTHELLEQQYHYFQERVRTGHVSELSIIE